MEPEFSLPSSVADTTLQNPASSQSRDHPPERCDDINVMEDDLKEKKMEMDKLLDKMKEKSSSVLELSLHLEELEKDLTSKEDLLREEAMKVELKEKSVTERILELEKKEEHLRGVYAVIKDKWTQIESFEAKLKAKADELELKCKSLELKENKLEEMAKELELKQSELEEQSIQAETLKRSMAYSQPLRKAHGESGSIDLPNFDSEFNDFGKTMSSFVVGQVWSIYDHRVDKMPRLYGRIKEVNESELSLLVTRLELQNEEPVPVGCGRFKYGATDTISYLMFSQEMHNIKRGKNFIAMYPRKGETWALFGDWNKSWKSNPEQHKQPYRYDFVEIEQNFDKVKGIGVIYLGKVEGFSSIFQRAGKGGILQIMFPADEMNRFSHRIPSFKMIGTEKEGVPAASFELDPAAIPNSVLNFKHFEDKDEEIQDCGEDESTKVIPIVISD